MARKSKTASQDASTLNEQKIAKKGTWSDRNEELVKRSHLVFIAILVFGQSPDPRVWHDTVRVPSAPGTEPQRVGYGVHGRCRCEPWGQDILPKLQNRVSRRGMV